MKKAAVHGAVFFFLLAALPGCGDSRRSPASESPYSGNSQEVKEGAKMFSIYCQGCHGTGGRGDVGPALVTKKKKYGDTDADLFLSVAKGRGDAMPGWESTLGPDKIREVIAYLRSIEK